MSTVIPMVAVRQGKFKLIVSLVNPAQLFDLEALAGYPCVPPKQPDRPRNS